MSDNKNKGDKVRRKVQWTVEDRARHQAIRDMFRDWHPTPLTDSIDSSSISWSHNNLGRRFLEV